MPLPSQQLGRTTRIEEDSPLIPHSSNMDAHHHLEATQTQSAGNKLVVTLPEELLTTLRTSCAEKANVSLLGRIQGKHPGHKALTAWARENLHPSLNFISLKANKLFEITFSSPEGRIHALTQNELVCESAIISFSSWQPHFDVNTHQPDFPIWVQIVDLCQILRDETILRAIGGHIGQVIAIDSSEAYRAKLFGPRIRILVRDIDHLPNTVVLPRLDGEGFIDYQLEYSGLPHQCGRCRSRDHLVRHCPRRDFKVQRREQPRPKPSPTNPDPHPSNPQTETHTVTQTPGPTPHLDLPQPDTDIEIPIPTEASIPTVNPTSPAPVPPETQVIDYSPIPELQPNDINFPQLLSQVWEKRLRELHLRQRSHQAPHRHLSGDENQTANLQPRRRGKPS